MRRLNFCGGCGILIPREGFNANDDCPNCGTPYSFRCIGQFEEDDAERLETAFMDQTQ